MKKLKDLTKEELLALEAGNKWLAERIDELATDDASMVQADEFELMGAKVFDYHDHYSSFYLTTPMVYGAKAPEKVAGALDRDYLSEEQAKLYNRLCELNKAMEDAEEWDEERPEYAEMVEVCDKLAESITESLREYEDYSGYRDEKLEAILSGDSWLSDLETEDGRIKQVVWHY